MAVQARTEPFKLPPLAAVEAMPAEELPAAIVLASALLAAIGARLAAHAVEVQDAGIDDAVSEAEAMRMLGLDRPRWLRRERGRAFRLAHKVGGHPVYSRRKLLSFLRGGVVETDRGSG